VPGEPGRVDQQRSERLHPAVDGDVIDYDPTLREEFLDIAVRQSVTQIPAHGQDDEVWRESVTRERRGYRYCWARTSR
jgi:hypothetical protein